MNKPIHVIQYNSDSSPDVVFDYLNNPDKDSNLWLRITSLKDTDFLMSVARHFGIHELSMEDVLNPKHQAKFEQESSYSLIILKRIQEVDSEIETSQFSMIFGQGFLITFGQTRNREVSNYIKSIGEHDSSIERTVYDLIDQLIDNYIVYASRYQEKTDDIEDRIVESGENYELSELFEFKQEMHQFKRIVRPVRELTDFLLRPKATIFSEDMYPYLKDLSDHANRVGSIAENIEETLTSLHSIVLTQLQYKLSKTMNLMTAVSVIFLPLMVITGVYGMNFEHMPELAFKYAYPTVLCIMATLGISMFLIFLKRKVI